jgi:hypothetical protein
MPGQSKNGAATATGLTGTFRKCQSWHVKVERRRAQLEESVARYLSQLDTADRSVSALDS